jgi:hypothetical protein
MSLKLLVEAWPILLKRFEIGQLGSQIFRTAELFELLAGQHNVKLNLQKFPTGSR